jgi:hypothetical protein
VKIAQCVIPFGPTCPFRGPRFPWVQKALDFILISFPMKLAVFGFSPDSSAFTLTSDV